MTIVSLSDYQYPQWKIRRKNTIPPNRTIAALDIGSAKTCCVIAKPPQTNDNVNIRNQKQHIDIIAQAQCPSSAVRRGKIIDLNEAQNVVAQTIQNAETQAQTILDSIYVVASGGYTQQHNYQATIELNQSPITKSHMNKAVRKAQSTINHNANKTILYSAIKTWTIDKHIPNPINTHNPINMHGENLTVTLTITTIDTPTLLNLETIIEKCHLNVEGYILSPQASANAALVTDEKIIGTLAIDIGAQLSDLSLFVNHAMIFADIIPIGGNDITMDIARVLATPINHAERMKIQHATLMTQTQNPKHQNANNPIAVPLVGETGTDALKYITQQKLTDIIEPRIEEIFLTIAAALKKNPHTYQSVQRIVLTGGTSQIAGMKEYAAKIFQKPTRNATQTEKYTNNPQYTAAIGALYAVINGDIHKKINHPHNTPQDNKFLKLRQWIQTNF